ncbi:MAG TPA: radical SAM family heme chaperone HemW [Acidimicrobiales bacterium]|nr:radical SAM family heme chaperone HemW [Acidimicrobiales bacterium]
MGARTSPTAVAEGLGGAEHGVYLHVPFCLKRCDYCAFATWDDRQHLLDAYVDGLRREVVAAVAAGLPDATTVFLGGGTPSLLRPDQLAAVLDAVPRAPGAEVTIECNPDTLDAEKLAGYRAAGVNRISLGVQSMVPSVLAALGRTHDPANVQRAAADIVAVGFPTWNVDLIYGAVGERRSDWQRTLDEVLDLDPPHVSAYGLTVEAGTPLAATPERHPDDDDQADKYLATEATLTAAGLASYEVSNWARPGHECRHNRCYWSQSDYRGFGCAAHSHVAGRRWWNVRTPERYLALVGGGEPVEAAGESLSPSERRLEALQLALRTREGVPAEALSDDDLDVLGDLVERRGDRLCLTLSGRLLANEVALRLRVAGG